MRKIIIAMLVIVGIGVAPSLYAANLFGIVSDNNGKPIETKVTLKDDKGDTVGAPVSTDKNGAYSFKEIKPGSYQIIISEKNEGKVFVGPGETRRDFRLK
jgi:hypothetical protein